MLKTLEERFDGRLPRTRAQLISLPGIGRKCADIMLRFVWRSRSCRSTRMSFAWLAGSVS
ncbi:Helix-hairpin-helix motif-containing protein [Arboricoccus pini]|uniref:Helix-hairpin-helix motif-containing protein n=1 Tax=Arboricoccus pini TaxID=1963835 RepID=A0A212QQ08_9PROT|nr:Helix-hairpin-helix motif-containing protein [Arboricoccus pini]